MTSEFSQKQRSSASSGMADAPSRGISDISQQQRQQYDWVDVFKEQGFRKQHQQDQMRVNELARKEKYRKILEQEISEKEARRLREFEKKKTELEEIEGNVKMNNRAEEIRNQKLRQHEKAMMDLNISIGQQKKADTQNKKQEEAEKTRQLYTLSNLEMKRTNDVQIEQKRDKEQQFNKQLDSQMKENRHIKEVIDGQQRAFEESLKRPTNKIIGQSQSPPQNERRKYEAAEKAALFDQIEKANRERERRQRDFENLIVHQGLQEQLQRERREEEIKRSEKQKMQSVTDEMVGIQLELKKTSKLSNQQAQIEERNNANATYNRYLEAEKHRLQNQRQLYQRQNYINSQQAQLKGQIKDRQKHMNENEVKLNSDKLLYQDSRSPLQVSNQIYMDDYISFDRQKQLKQLDHTLGSSVNAKQAVHLPIFSSPQSNFSQQNQTQNRSVQSPPQYQQYGFKQFPQSVNSFPSLPSNGVLPLSPKEASSFSQFSPRNEIKPAFAAAAAVPQSPPKQLVNQSVQQQQSTSAIDRRESAQQQKKGSPRIPSQNSLDFQPMNRNERLMRQSYNDSLKSGGYLLKQHQQQDQQQMRNSISQLSLSQTHANRKPSSPENYYNKLGEVLKIDNNHQNTSQSIAHNQLNNKNEKQFNIKAINMLNGNPISSSSNSNSHHVESNRDHQQIPIYRNPPRDIFSNRIAAGVHLADKGQVFEQPVSRVQKTGSQPNLNMMQYIDNRTNIISAQKQDYSHIRSQNGNWASRGFNIITGVQ